MSNLPALRVQDCKEFMLLQRTLMRGWWVRILLLCSPALLMNCEYFDFVGNADCSAWED
jgi:hypothetical protein